MEVCKICDKEFSMYNIQRHIRGSHKLSTPEIKDYYDKYYKKEGEGICPFSNEETEFNGIKLGYKKYLNTPEVRKKSFASNSIEFQMKVNGLSLEDANNKMNDSNAQMAIGVKETFAKNVKEDPDYLKAMSRYCKEFWIKKGHSEEESIKLAWNEGEYNRNKFKEKLETEGSEWFKKRNSCCIEYWLEKGYSKKEAAIRLKNRQVTFSKEICIEKYGEENGLERWNNRQDIWKAKVFNKDTYIGRGTSIVSDKFFKILESKLYDSYEILSGKDEKFIRHKNGAFKYDFTLKNAKKIIEFNGDYWHCNPFKYEKDYYHSVKKMTALEIWKYDDNKIKLAEQYGYKIITIWERDYYNNPEEEINRCLKFIYD